MLIYMIDMAFNPVNTLFCNIFILLTDKSLDMNKVAIDMSLDKKNNSSQPISQ